MGIRRNSQISSSSPRKSTSLQHLFLLEHSDEGNKSSLDGKLEDILHSMPHAAVDPYVALQDLESNAVKLQEISFLITSSKTCITSNRVVSSLMKIITANIFRPLPPPTIWQDLYDAILDSYTSPLWPTLHPLYTILLNLLITLDHEALSELVDRTFIINLLPLFRSEDTRERERVKHVYHQVYLRFESHRTFMRECMNHMLLQHSLGLEHINGVAELLEIWSSIIAGWEPPFKEEEKALLNRVIVPLHKSKCVQFYYRQLWQCVRQFVGKESELGMVVIKALLRYWPITNCVKEVLFITEIEELVQIMEIDMLQHDHHLALKLFTQISKCSNSSNSQVAERALCMWNNEKMVKMALRTATDVVGVVVDGLEWNLAWHWSKSVKHLTGFVKEMLQGLDPCLYKKCVVEIGTRKQMSRRDEILRKQTWKILESQASYNT